MPSGICIMHANCQGDLIKAALENCPGFARRFTIYKFTNYLKEHIPENLLSECELMLYQHLADKWEELSSNSLLSALPHGAKTIQIPNMLFKGYWPFWTNAAPVAFGDIFLERLIGLNLSFKEIMTIYLRGNIAGKYDLEAMRQASLETERDKERDSPIKTVDLVEELWRKKQLFHTINHPSTRLILHVVEKILELLGLEPPPSAVRAGFKAEYEGFELPIHPRVGSYFSLPFATENRIYNIYGRPMTFSQYASAYVQCRLNNIDDFVSFLHLVPVKQTEL